MFVFIYWVTTALFWYLISLAISLTFLPLNTLIFGKFKDRGYAFSKVLGLALFGYTAFFLNSLKIMPFNQNGLFWLLAAFLGLNLFLLNIFKPKLPKLSIVLCYELFFLLMFAGYLYLKGFEASIHSLEKYMDFGFIQSLLNTKYMPPQDMWFASTLKESLSINYYYFGHFISALLIRMSGTIPSIGYNLMLGHIFAFGTTLSFALGFNLYQLLAKPQNQKNALRLGFLSGVLSMAIMNFGGNLHTIYLFTKGYLADNPVPFWQIWSNYNPSSYWYPNATRFIPLTIHEFPSYSYVVSDLHGHVLDIPFVLLILALSIVIVQIKNWRKLLLPLGFYSLILAINYMTNSTDFIVYSVILFFVLMIVFDHLTKVLALTGITGLTALVLTLPFSINFKPFASSLGVNCAPDFLVAKGSLGPLLFEANKCQNSPTWMLFILWGFFWIIFLIFLKTIFFNKKREIYRDRITYYFFFVFTVSILLTLFAEFFYFKDIYPAHFRANTMFKLGYQSFIMMSILSGVVIVYVFKGLPFISKIFKLILIIILLPLLTLVLIYYQYALPSYFGKTGFQTLDGTYWIKQQYPDSYQIIQKLNQLKATLFDFNIVEAHGDSYSDYNLISAHTGLPTIVGWPVHEWLWRGSYDVVRPRAAEVQLIYEGDEKDLLPITKILKKYKIKFIIVAEMEKRKYPILNSQKFYKIAQPIYINKKTNSYLFKLKIND
ncbi:hypothetical protein A2313_01795 [Candidatus Roizmanbacteria bacterium RIFOXYB2_FULL_41_10]|uniref:YYY membrane protein n=1 Tax=Candidatus Roizmanbacteria bacterium RIFOXYA1_FULL_41_12 TaxID=1802082 RepID=A0A1F7K5N7_9BACT|nr:MAG: hypothetical protein A2209_02850 [Candidatus Roizmanbacteria bacterium RIFOXYA1_FULL_41_12]OGK66667.1 MAG: hypothetical protein A2262_03440 [Candidatus Roizmanbacteria bacterium RIFOXYA2_FULL_41_8]OGK67523.1 MAG: hypothetical protein A2377_01600 [Candidatus Roizmanbacteria bacterium RIFOXYB1_FULL_41_27]OGK71179.1 MAG: hypothetical protein A2403_00330 [Candidatus Roizmanbacteria bacterium RIFOXYC1_FULL_41_16]OGK72057.1 MAG: hypothetical protein A2313_01795 [Candidatus Roizmanbacteria bac